ncbi:MAG TPA: hypothetical protein PLV92_18715, partial [Pirellulaceae bacterium]|nr:hypothetical protein [Pirellulaceae bacterium]
EFRAPRNDDDLAQWVEIMRRHGYAPSEMSAATGVPADKLKKLAESQTTNRSTPPTPSNRLLVLPYPGGRHPRIGFRDGAIRPQRETKVSVFAPWQDGGYAVVDVPEAIWMGQGADRKLLYLAHTHVPTIWDQQQKSLEPLEWTRGVDGDPTRLRVERTLPNQVRFGAEVVAEKDRVRMELWLTNGSTEKLTGLVVQNCVMLAGLPGFETQNEQHKRFRSPMAAVGNATGDRWVVTAWERCVRPWANPPCPCVHSDPQFPDCEPGQTQRLRGWILFHEGADIDARLVKEGIRNEQ